MAKSLSIIANNSMSSLKNPEVATGNINPSPLGGDPVIASAKMPLAATTSKVSPEDLEKFVNYLPEGKRSPVDFANDMSKRGYWGASDMYKGAQDTAAAFARDGRLDPNNAGQNYKDNRKYSQLWHNELIQDVIGQAKKAGIKDKTAFLANKDYLLSKSRMNPNDFNTVMNQNAGNGESRGQNFWRVTGDLYNELQKKNK